MSDIKHEGKGKKSWSPDKDVVNKNAKTELLKFQSLVVEQLGKKPSSTPMSDAEYIRQLETERDLLTVQLGVCLDEKHRLSQKYDHMKTALYVSKTEKRDLMSKLRIAEAKVITRPYLESILKDVIPSWISNLKCVRQRDKLSVSFLFALTPYAKVLVTRNDTLPIPSDWKFIADSLCSLWEVFSRKVNHNENPVPISLQEEEWEELFTKVNIHMTPQKTVIKKMLEPIDNKELEIVKKEGHEDTYILYVNNLNIDVNDNGMYDSTLKIKEYCENFGDEIIDIYFPTNAKGDYSNEIFMKTKIVNSCDLEILKKKLSTYGKENTKVFFRNNYIHLSKSQQSRSIAHSFESSAKQTSVSTCSLKSDADRGLKSHRNYSRTHVFDDRRRRSKLRSKRSRSYSPESTRRKYHRASSRES